MNLQFGDIQETALIPLAIKASETARPNARIKDLYVYHCNGGRFGILFQRAGQNLSEYAV